MGGAGAMEVGVDYPRVRYERGRRHERYRRFVEGMEWKLVCQECRGSGGDHPNYLSYDPGEQCGFCEGTGLVTPWLRGLWLGWKREEKRGRRG